ncbi:MAG: ATP phosphoribosyltransferase [Deltaproteobacteria bacterium]|nr:ATP phosphoribosyltransferase [Deltaproteobacteria bacterium]MBI3077245.1 ATP phosphoribosyltransferase [Deltaproteobacteria bacterium]
MPERQAERLTVALPKGRTLGETVALFRRGGMDLSEAIREESRRLAIDLKREGLRFIIVRPQDIPTYVEYGAADLGVVGKDVLLEQERDVYEPLDLKIGACRIVVAEPEARVGRQATHLRVATKYPRITERYFAGKGQQVEVIKLYGSIELAPLTGLADRIVDLVDTGATLREHGLVEVEEIARATARLIANRASLKTKYARISAIVEALRRAVNGEETGR